MLRTTKFPEMPLKIEIREPSPFSTLQSDCGKKEPCRDLVIGRDAGMCRSLLLSTTNSAIHNFAHGPMGYLRHGAEAALVAAVKMTRICGIMSRT